MPNTARRLLAVAATTLLTAVLFTAVTFVTEAWAADPELPAPIAQLTDHGISDIKRFDAPGELQGFAGRANGHRLALYLTPDKQHVIVGNMFDADGQNQTKSKLKQVLGQDTGDNTWQQLEDSHWIGDGNSEAPITVYEFVDPNCPYCHKFYEQSRPWVKNDQVEIRHILVAVLKPSSQSKAAAILQADKPARAFAQHENQYASGGIEPADTIKASTKKAIAQNTRLMSRLKIRGTPGLVYKDDSGDIQIKQGLPGSSALKKIFGPK